MLRRLARRVSIQAVPSLALAVLLGAVPVAHATNDHSLCPDAAEQTAFEAEFERVSEPLELAPVDFPDANVDDFTDSVDTPAITELPQLNLLTEQDAIFDRVFERDDSLPADDDAAASPVAGTEDNTDSDQSADGDDIQSQMYRRDI